MISNQPRIKGRTTFAYAKIDNAFTSEDVERINLHCSSQKKLLKDATIVGGPDAPRIRISKTFFETRNQENSWFFEKLNNIIEIVNNEFYGFDLWGYESYQYGEYYGTDGGKYDLHTDMLTDDINELNANAYNMGTRKLSLSLMLSQQNTDFTGGDFVVATGKEQNAEVVNIPIGGVVVFPSFIVHGVKPVTSGIRRSIVAWVVGPKFK